MRFEFHFWTRLLWATTTQRLLFCIYLGDTCSPLLQYITHFLLFFMLTNPLYIACNGVSSPTLEVTSLLWSEGGEVEFTLRSAKRVRLWSSKQWHSMTNVKIWWILQVDRDVEAAMCLRAVQRLDEADAKIVRLKSLMRDQLSVGGTEKV